MALHYFGHANFQLYIRKELIKSLTIAIASTGVLAMNTVVADRLAKKC